MIQVIIDQTVHFSFVEMIICDEIFGIEVDVLVPWVVEIRGLFLHGLLCQPLLSDGLSLVALRRYFVIWVMGVQEFLILSQGVEVGSLIGVSQTVSSQLIHVALMLAALADWIHWTGTLLQIS